MAYDEAKVLKVLRSVFGYENFLNATQKDAIATIVKGNPSVCISMPPGSGRSLCFQLPAIVQGKIAVIISPKLSLIKKQVDFLRSKQINACLLHQGLYPNKKRRIINNLTSPSPTIQLLYVTVEMAVLTYIQKMIFLLKRHKLLSYIVFNEAHCLSTLGYEYVAIYERINMICDIFDDIPRIAVTTTVNSEVINDICNLLLMKNAKSIKLAVQQNKVFYDVQYLDTLTNPFSDLINFIKEVLGYSELRIQEIVEKGCAVIYCREEQTAELLMNKLNVCGIPTLTCHHKLRQNIQRNIENNWISGKACVITTTYNYGFIYRNIIRCIVYWTVPENISKYYRESMQTYRYNGQPHCRVYLSKKEYLSMKALIENRDIIKGAIHTERRLIEYDKFMSYCLSIKCRHMLISKYFGCVTSPCKRYCDVCTDRWIVEKAVDTFLMLFEDMQELKYSFHKMIEDLSNEETDFEMLEMNNNNQLLRYNDNTGIGNAVYSTFISDLLEDTNNVREESLYRELSRDTPKRGTNFEILEIKDKNNQLLQCSDETSIEISVYSTIISDLLKDTDNVRKESLYRELSRDTPKRGTDFEILGIKDKNNQLLQYNDNTGIGNAVYSTVMSELLEDTNNVRKENLYFELSRDSSKRGTDCEIMPVRDITKPQCNIKTSSKDIVRSTSTPQSLVNENDFGIDATCSCEICRNFSDEWIDCTRTVKENTKRIVPFNEKSSVKDTVPSTFSAQFLEKNNNLRKEKPPQKLENSTYDVQKSVRRKSYSKTVKRKRMNPLNINKVRVNEKGDFSSSRNSEEIVVIQIDSDDEPVIEMGITTDKPTIKKQSTNQLKNDSNVKRSRDNAIIDSLFNKYNLNRQAITLEIRKT